MLDPLHVHKLGRFVAIMCSRGCGLAKVREASHRITHLHNLCMDFPQVKEPNGASMRNTILRKLIAVNSCFLQFHVPYTLLGALAILKIV